MSMSDMTGPDRRNIVYLVRHGESMGNVSRRLLSASEDLLTETGRNQAAKLGEHFAEAGIKWSRVYSSDYPRAFDTAEGILSKTSQKNELKIKTDPRLRERFYGDLEGLTYKEGFQMYHEYATRKTSLSIMEFEMPNGELVASTVARLHSFFHDLFEDLDKNPTHQEDSMKPETVLIVSHSFAMVSFMNDLSITNKDPKYKLVNWDPKTDLKVMRNMSYMKIAVQRKPTATEEEGLRELEFLVKHETKHLDGISTHGAFSKFATETTEAKQFTGCIQQ